MTTILERSPQRIAYMIIERIYAWFGAGPEVIPYTALNDGQERVIDVERIKAGGRKAQ